MKKHFSYLRKEKEIEYTDTFNVDKVIRSVSLEDGRRLVLLDDLHERVQETPEIDLKTNKVKGVKRQRDVFQSEIYLSNEDNIRFLDFIKE